MPFTGYTLDSFREDRNGFTAQLNLAGAPCNAFGNDILNLTIQVTYETASRCVFFLSATAWACVIFIDPRHRLHVNIFDKSALPSAHFDPPKKVENLSSPVEAELEFNYEPSPFAFWITRRSDPGSTPVFDTRLTSLPSTPIPAFRGRTSDPSLVFHGFPFVFEDRHLQVRVRVTRLASM